MGFFSFFIYLGLSKWTRECLIRRCCRPCCCSAPGCFFVPTNPASRQVPLACPNSCSSASTSFTIVQLLQPHPPLWLRPGAQAQPAGASLALLAGLLCSTHRCAGAAGFAGGRDQVAVVDGEVLQHAFDLPCFDHTLGCLRLHSHFGIPAACCPPLAACSCARCPCCRATETWRAAGWPPFCEQFGQL